MGIDLMSADLQRIEKVLAQISETLQRQSEDLRDLREQIKSLVLVATPAPVSVVIDPDCGYEWIGVHIQLDADTWSRVKAGEHIKIRGKGWVPDEDVGVDEEDDLFHWDHWEFNGGIGKPMKVTMICPHDEVEDLGDGIAYEGPLLRSFIQEVKDL
jgi:hypothetical protein